MVRIPKFRAWDKTDKKMIHWEQMKSEFTFGYFEDENLDFMQSTGLFDKNGVEIFESDLVRWTHSTTGSSVVGVVKYDSQLGFWGMTDPRYKKELSAIGYVANQDVEIIGNVYANPELVQ